MCHTSNPPEKIGKVIITLKSGVRVMTAPEPLEDARMTASGFQIAVNNYLKDCDPVVKSTSDLFINILEIAAIEVITL